jgi:hypothetical protein
MQRMASQRNPRAEMPQNLYPVWRNFENDDSSRGAIPGCLIRNLPSGYQISHRNHSSARKSNGQMRDGHPFEGLDWDI